MSIQTYDTHTLIGVINKLAPLRTFWLDLFFTGQVNFDSEWIYFDQIAEGRQLAPFVAPTAQGKVMRDQGRTMKMFKPAYVKPKHVIDPTKIIKRRAGEALGSGSLSPAQRFDAAVADRLDVQRKMIIRRWEAMAAEAVRLGSVTVEGEDYPRVVVDFGRDSSQRVTLASGAKWGETGVSIYDNLQSWITQTHQLSGYAPTMLIVAPDVWEVMRKDDEIKELLDATYKGGGSVDLDFGIGTQDGVQYKGKLGPSLSVYTYSDFYEDESGAKVPMLPAGEIVLAAPEGHEGYRCFGAIMDKRAGYQPLAMFPKVWDQEDPSVTYLMTQSAPLMVPARPNVVFSAKVK